MLVFLENNGRNFEGDGHYVLLILIMILVGMVMVIELMIMTMMIVMWVIAMVMIEERLSVSRKTNWRLSF